VSDSGKEPEKNESKKSGGSLWGGRFVDGSDEFFFQFNQSLSYDYRLFPMEIRGSKAYASGLFDLGVFTSEELKSVHQGLDELTRKVEADPQIFKKGVEAGIEDIHSFVETHLVSMIGDTALKLHTGRSRNDQVSTDFRIYCREAIDYISGRLKSLLKVIVKCGIDHQEIYMPGYTHLQKAQPVLWGHYLLSFCEMFERDLDRLSDARRRTNILPLGSGALSGNSWGIDREKLMKDLEFEGLSANSMDATSDRDFVFDIHSALSLLMVHQSRLCEDLIIYCTNEFSLVEMSDRLSTGSSLMPQKKNPDALELIRGKSGRVVGHLQALLLTMKGLPSCYNKDLQEDKEGLFDSLETVDNCLQVMTSVISEMKIKGEKMKRSAEVGCLNATELADYFCRKGVPFRKAHHLSGQIVLMAISKGKELEELSLREFREVFEDTTEDVKKYLTIKSTIESKRSFGGTNPDRVRKALEVARSKY